MQVIAEIGWPIVLNFHLNRLSSWRPWRVPFALSCHLTQLSTSHWREYQGGGKQPWAGKWLTKEETPAGAGRESRNLMAPRNLLKNLIQIFAYPRGCIVHSHSEYAEET